jgi:methyltransferase
VVNAGLLLFTLVGFVAVQRAVELVIAGRHAAWARARGALEFGARHYPLIVALHVMWLVAWPLEAWAQGPRLADRAPTWLLVFLAAQVLRYAAIAALGRRWNTRILVLPGMPPIRRGPYLFLKHPNYVAVVAELAALPLMFDAVYTATIVGALNLALLLFVRIPVEARALGSYVRRATT